jgi:hypothetical protein
MNQPKLLQLKTQLGNGVIHENRGLLLYFMVGDQPYTCIAQANEEPGAEADDDVLIVSGNQPKGYIFRSTDVNATYNYIQSL